MQQYFSFLYQTHLTLTQKSSYYSMDIENENGHSPLHQDENMENVPFQSLHISSPLLIPQQNLIFPNQENVLTLDESNQIPIVSSSTKRPKKIKIKISNTQKNPFEIDSKQLSVEQMRQQIPKPCIVLQPEIIPLGYAINLDESNFHVADPAINPSLSVLPNELIQQIAQDINPNDIKSAFSQLIKQNQGNLPDLIQNRIIQSNPLSNGMQFDRLFQQPVEQLNEQQQMHLTLKNLAKQIEHTQLKDGEVMVIPKQLGDIVTNKISLLQQPKMREICQQFVMITFYDLITGEQQKFQVRKLIKSNYKEQMCAFILQRLMIVDLSYCYHNVDILKMISSKWIWDNVVPFMAESLYKDCNLLRTRLLPERCNNDSVTLIKYHAFLIMSQMFFGLLPRQISTYDLPISFGEIMTLGENDSALVIENKKSKLRCLLHYFSSILREKQKTLHNSVQFVAFQRFRVALKLESLCPQDEKTKLKYSNLKLTDHLQPATVKSGNQYSKQTAVYLTHQNPCRQSGEQNLQTPFLMEQTYRLMYAKPEIFILKALTPKLDLGQAIIVHGLQQFSKCYWKKEDTKTLMQVHQQEFTHRKFYCEGLYNEQADLDAYGKRKGTVILIMSKLLFGQSYIKNQVIKCNKITQNYSIKEIKIEIETLFSAFQGRKLYCNQDERILISERYIKFIEQECRWLYFVIVWIAASLARVKVVFEFQKHEHRVEATLLMKYLNGYTISSVIQILSQYRQTLIEAHQNWSREFQRVTQQGLIEHDWNVVDSDQEGIGEQKQKQHILGGKRSKYLHRASNLTFLDFLKDIY